MDKKKLSQVNLNHLGNGLKGLRISNSYSLDDLAFYSSKDTGYLSRLENGKVSPKFETISEILACYNITVKEFYDKLDSFI